MSDGDQGLYIPMRGDEFDDEVKEATYPQIKKCLEALDAEDDTLFKYVILLIKNHRSRSEFATQLEEFLDDSGQALEFANSVWTLLLPYSSRGKPQAAVEEEPPPPSPKSEPVARSPSPDRDRGRRSSRSRSRSPPRTRSPRERGRQRDSRGGRGDRDRRGDRNDRDRARRTTRDTRSDRERRDRSAPRERDRDEISRERNEFVSNRKRLDGAGQGRLFARVLKDQGSKNRRKRKPAAPLDEEAPDEVFTPHEITVTLHGGAPPASKPPRRDGPIRVEKEGAIARKTFRVLKRHAVEGDTRAAPKPKPAIPRRTFHMDTEEDQLEAPLLVTPAPQTQPAVQVMPVTQAPPQPTMKVVYVEKARSGPIVQKSLQVQKVKQVVKAKEQDNSSPLVSADSKQVRCSFFPACTNVACKFVHPTQPCTYFPACTRGQSCLFLHPDCKFGAKCTNKACAYFHPARRAPPLSRAPRVKCKFGTTCTRSNCTFDHPAGKAASSHAGPTPCRFGKNCTREGCTFGHPEGGNPTGHAGAASDVCAFDAKCTLIVCNRQHPQRELADAQFMAN